MRHPFLRAANKGGVAPSYTYNGYVSSITNASSYTFNNVSIGSAASHRLVVVAIGVVSLTTYSTPTFSSVQIAGSAATEITKATNSGTGIGIYSLNVPSNTTATIGFGTTSTMTAASVAVYSLYNLASYTPVDKKAYSAGGFASAGLPYTQALGVNQDNIMISKGFYIDGSDYATIWTGVTEDYEFRLESVTEVSGASGIAPSSGSTNIVFNSSPATSKTGFTMASAAFG